MVVMDKMAVLINDNVEWQEANMYHSPLLMPMGQLLHIEHADNLHTSALADLNTT